jgi:hypothetical protein
LEIIIITQLFSYIFSWQEPFAALLGGKLAARIIGNQHENAVAASTNQQQHVTNKSNKRNSSQCFSLENLSLLDHDQDLSDSEWLANESDNDCWVGDIDIEEADDSQVEPDFGPIAAAIAGGSSRLSLSTILSMDSVKVLTIHPHSHELSFGFRDDREKGESD